MQMNLHLRLEELYSDVFTQPFCHKQDVIQSQFLSQVKLVWIQSFYTRLVS